MSDANGASRLTMLPLIDDRASAWLLQFIIDGQLMKVRTATYCILYVNIIICTGVYEKFI